MNTTREEEWRDIPGYEGYYQASDQGNIRSLARVVPWRDGLVSRRAGQVLKPMADKKLNYPKVGLYVLGRRKMVQVHKLILVAFAGPTPEGMEICHNDGNPWNNRLENLRFGTSADNAQDRLRHGTNYNANKTHCIRGHEFTPENTRFHKRRGSRICVRCKLMKTEQWRARVRSHASK